MANLIITDQPILEAGDDRYGFSDMAKLIAEDIAAMTDARGTIIGIDGEWGSGKTSFTNLLLDHLRPFATADHADGAGRMHVEVIRTISAWKEADIVKALLDAIQQRVVLETGQAGENTENAAAMAGALEKGGEWLTSGADAADRLGFDAGGVGLLKNILRGIGTGMIHLGSTGKREAERIHAGQQEEAHTRVSAMRDSGRLRLVLTIDDADRLLAKEMVGLFSLLRDIVDESGVVVILPIASQSAAKLLDAATGGQGSAYLGKVLTNQFSVPEISRDARAELLRDMVADWIKPDNEFPWLDWSSKDFTSFENWFVDHFVLTPRDFKRLEAAVRMRMRLQRDTLFVLDVVAVELARLFDGAAFSRLESLHEWLASKDVVADLGRINRRVSSPFFIQDRWGDLMFRLWLPKNHALRRRYNRGDDESVSSADGISISDAGIRSAMEDPMSFWAGRFWSRARRASFFNGQRPKPWMQLDTMGGPDWTDLTRIAEAIAETLHSDEKAHFAFLLDMVFRGVQVAQPNWLVDRSEKSLRHVAAIVTSARSQLTVDEIAESLWETYFRVLGSVVSTHGTVEQRTWPFEDALFPDAVAERILAGPPGKVSAAVVQYREWLDPTSREDVATASDLVFHAMRVTTDRAERLAFRGGSLHFLAVPHRGWVDQWYHELNPISVEALHVAICDRARDGDVELVHDGRAWPAKLKEAIRPTVRAMVSEDYSPLTVPIAKLAYAISEGVEDSATESS